MTQQPSPAAIVQARAVVEEMADRCLDVLSHKHASEVDSIIAAALDSARREGILAAACSLCSLCRQGAPVARRVHLVSHRRRTDSFMHVSNVDTPLGRRILGHCDAAPIRRLLNPPDPPENPADA